MYRQATRLEETARPVLLARATEWTAVEYAANVTDLELIPAPPAGWRLIVHTIVVSTDAAGTVLFEQGNATRFIGRLNFAADGSFVLDSPLGLRLAESTSLTMTTTTGAGPLAVTIGYATVPSTD